MTFRLMATLFSLLLMTQVQAGQHLNILIYHHVSENTPASTSVSTEQFRTHLQLLKDEGFTVVDLRTTLAKLQRGEEIADNAVAITFDDGFHNIYDNAWPLLKEYGYPFTLFVATDAIDQGYNDMMTWDQLREMKKAGVTVANHSTDHGYLVRQHRRDRQWLNRVQNNIEQAQARLQTELGDDIPLWFAYPYGEFTLALADRLADMGYLGFAQHSGGVWSESNFQAMPRFAAAGIYANPEMLLTKLRSRPMPVDESRLADMITSEPKPVLDAHLLQRDDFAPVLNCFVDGNWQEATWPSELTFRVSSSVELNKGRHRYNCTAKSQSGDFYYWFSKPWLLYGLDDR